MIAPVPSTSGMPAIANSKKPKPPSPASSAAFDRSTFTGEPTSVSRPPALAENASGMAICEIGMPTRIAATTATGKSAATAPMKLIAAVNSTQTSMRRTSSRVRLAPCLLDQDLPRPGGHARRLQARADDEQRGDEDHHRVAQAGERRAGVEHTGVEQRERHAERHDGDRHAVPDEQRNGRGQDGEGDGDVAHERRDHFGIGFGSEDLWTTIRSLPSPPRRNAKSLSTIVTLPLASVR